MRIIAGRWRGRPLVAPQGQATRPTSDRTREALFSMLASRVGSFEGLKVADLCAGTGALGLEALSRGAAHCTFVERDRAAVEALRANIARLGAEAEVRAIAAESFAGGAYDLVLIDPPYGTGLGQKILPAIGVAPGGWVSIETARGETVAVPGFTVEAERVHGKARITLLRSVP
ncbi:MULTISPECIES: 16S rRNA (guanine(966)-N(2))-methyltransferase RsmD [unclassified Sphingomonas]|uniref:16S rRNA (guanine(966)-N(2))-methyltransferase RsmD n=1 Tax=unclassified Sphingomonas TaxID=196159 RepID=UPI0006FB0600|nr:MULTISPECIES: 16S rRNA (guanine(966)-N(2))-methyltransferase RsmD [unclassified Sphingomonas]KQX25334.1 16S rRNA (guanine(966)-N(2))-methyltransferase RsmD [Sphingomonas sp. Root1294]KQY66327.1 16S rRNA (guanine(966)-N(2))-methyltransferase RsmD [Sphingomonas sp. Root50]KRB90363.1 16S rRNA (guanine(966)-N(2))-methyltransferase RsmD [Sphingomonas sp. Root720]